ncbi:bleomycin resistance protein [Mucilaginibacter sp. PPCGB 2223]|uniref:VOC family protein n=1 Tax=Mucilaginibacter sp. PPCGB 2223 TaxID=1886027 RepID=UPI00082716D0|nr:glyoxalase/bleomycin resistance/extradiol dioxygenase family protein [Mucilaginibacter sp. PPCGB 2223]OCX50730.1 bleomycin resistance protein [Mucilaginibacter sp. PPCGB 2223]
MQRNIKLSVPFFMVKDMEASLNFYCEGLGFKMTNQWTPRGKVEWCWLERDAVSIMLQQPRELNAEPLGRGVTICHQCGDALALYHEFLDKGVFVKEPFVGNGMWVVSLQDPDGYRLEFESLTDVPEETTYSNWMKK